VTFDVDDAFVELIGFEDKDEVDVLEEVETVDVDEDISVELVGFTDTDDVEVFLFEVLLVGFVVDELDVDVEGFEEVD
jgi:hypothetical protein